MRKADQAFLAFSERVLKRDEYTCQYCGFVAKEHMEVVNLDGNFLNNALNNLVTACPFCAQCFFLESVGKSEGSGGLLIYLPDLSQGELNALCHALFTAIINNSSVASQAKNIYRDLRLRSQPVEKEVGAGYSQPAIYGRVLVESQSKNAKAVHSKVTEKIRLLPEITKFVPYLEDWSHSAIRELST